MKRRRIKKVQINKKQKHSSQKFVISSHFLLHGVQDEFFFQTSSSCHHGSAHVGLLSLHETLANAAIVDVYLMLLDAFVITVLGLPVLRLADFRPDELSFCRIFNDGDVAIRVDLEQAIVEHLLNLLSLARHVQPLPLTLLQCSLHLIKLGQLGLDLLLLLQSCQLLLLDLLLAASSFAAYLEKVTTVAIRD